MSETIDRFPRASYADIRLYSPERVEADLDLSDNTNQWGAPPSVARTLGRLDGRLLTQYPPQPMIELQDALASYAGAPSRDCIVAGCGSDDILDCIMRAFAEPGDVVVHAQPTFSMIPYFARTNGLRTIGVPYRSDWDIDTDAMLAADARIVYLCAPNNPTGTMISRESVRRILDETRGIVVLDEAYIEFAGDSWASRAALESRLVVTRTMSKAFGLAGLRVGYAVGAPHLVHEIEKARGPYKVTTVSSLVALEVLRNDLEWVRDRAQEAVSEREWLRNRLTRFGLEPLPSAANFLLVPFAQSGWIAQEMGARRILVRAFRDLPGIGNALRIGVAPRFQLERFVNELEPMLERAGAMA